MDKTSCLILLDPKDLGPVHLGTGVGMEWVTSKTVPGDYSSIRLWPLLERTDSTMKESMQGLTLMPAIQVLQAPTLPK